MWGPRWCEYSKYLCMHAYHLIICKLLLPPEQLVFNYICVCELQLNKSTPQLHKKWKPPSPNVLLVSGWPRATTKILLVKLHLWAKLGSTWTWSHDHQKRTRTLEKAMHPCKTVNKRFENTESLN